jgi:DNA adenine methylase
MNSPADIIELPNIRSQLIALCKERGIKGYSGKSKDELVTLLQSKMEHKNKSPLRYPGGKTRAIKILEKYIQRFKCKKILSPFFGGGSFELYLYDNGYQVWGNDLFKPLYTFWKTIQTLPELVIEAVRKQMPVSKEHFYALRKSIETHTLTDPVDIAAAYYIINRTSFSGATFCGGFSIEASTGRLNEASLKNLESLQISGIQFSNLDYSIFLDMYPDSEDLLIYADPPYYISSYIYGKNGDLHESFNHVSFATKIKSRKNWILSYNDCEYIRNLYSDCDIFSESWTYGMNSSKDSSEIIIVPKRTS